VTNITVDLDAGTRTFTKASGTGEGITPDETFKVVTKDQTAPPVRKFPLGVVGLDVSARKVSFFGRKPGIKKGGKRL
jgi:hypothetical protein